MGTTSAPPQDKRAAGQHPSGVRPAPLPLELSSAAAFTVADAEALAVGRPRLRRSDLVRGFPGVRATPAPPTFRARAPGAPPPPPPRRPGVLAHNGGWTAWAADPEVPARRPVARLRRLPRPGAAH